MNFLPLPSLPLFSALIVIASVVGVSSYLAVSSIKNKNPFLIGFWVFLMVSTVVSFVQSQFAYGILGFLVTIAVVGAGTEAVARRGEAPFWFRLWRMSLAIYFSLFLGGLLLVFYLMLFLGPISEEPWVWVYFYGLSVSPILFPVFLYLIRLAKLRPGLDRHFLKSESPQEKGL